jgi:ribosomal protein S27AE
MPGGSSADILLPMWNDPAAEWRRLTEHYKSLSDDELRELSADKADLTEVAQQALRDEIKLRGLSESKPTTSVDAKEVEINEELPSRDFDFALIPPARGADEDRSDPNERVEYTWKTVLCDCETQEQAQQLAEALLRAGITSWVRGRGRRCPQIMVAADQLEEARMIANQPIPQDIIDQLKKDAEGPEEYFELPDCPTCGAGDPFLEGVDPANRWRCGACGRRWIEEETAAPAEGTS